MAYLKNAKYAVEDRVAIITLDHPPVNAFNAQTVQDLDAAIDMALEDEAVKVIIITGAGQMAFALALFADRCGQYIFISSASAYQKPLTYPIITESGYGLPYAGRWRPGAYRAARDQPGHYSWVGWHATPAAYSRS